MEHWRSLSVCSLVIVVSEDSRSFSTPTSTPVPDRHLCPCAQNCFLLQQRRPPLKGCRCSLRLVFSRSLPWPINSVLMA